ncbi:helicase [Campylobacter sp. RM15925]|uniref:helicase n=1 Tax=Campylobacter sp. RM15925 TaxID=1705724 RepID=UPI0014734CC3
MMISGELLNLNTHRKVAKVGMSVTLATVCLTSFNLKSKAAKRLHVASGWAFVGFSLYHAGLYDNGIFKNMIINAQKKQAVEKRLAKTAKTKKIKDVDKRS